MLPDGTLDDVGSGEVPHQGSGTAAVQQTQYTGTFVHHHTLPPGVAYGGGQPHGAAAVAGRGALPYTMLVMGPDIVEEEVFENERFQPFRCALRLVRACGSHMHAYDVHTQYAATIDTRSRGGGTYPSRTHVCHTHTTHADTRVQGLGSHLARALPSLGPRGSLE